MELLQLKYFQAAARIEHMTKAAQSLHISQPALSKMITALEAELGAKLFDRNHKTIRLNEQGRLFLQKIDLALQAIEDGIRQLQDGNGTAVAAIALDVRVSSHLLPALLAEYCKQWPDTQFHLIQHVPQYESTPSFDLCLSDGANPPAGTESYSLLREKIVVAVPAAHRLASSDLISLRELQDENFICLPPGKALREMTDAFCRLAGFAPRIRFESDDPATVRGLIRVGQGVAFLPSITWGGSTGPDVVTIPLEESFCERAISLYWPKDRYLTQAAAQFRDFAISYFAALADSYAYSSDK
ncbi:LysR family transcriptional regulator [Paenibacillus sp. MMS18-CY102]|uniref:LysR family transcriptional regulator n=1 Tax=Paenibacillus sp. MMS18-CY102 TaxID=2682849 RepID=UPI001365CB46|nr:LysR family transcriptional regulator [Paenibacillus sp. MMS18-CY102]MWC31369.1 LysR family transcriptional regulator [Paenibacillus sp. MMS18-CY102]